MKIFFDTEFTGLHKDTTLISIGLVDENGRSFYAEFSDYDTSQCDNWIYNNVIKHLKWSKEGPFEDFVVNKDNVCEAFGSKSRIKLALQNWLSKYDNVQLVSDVCHYDMVLFIDIFGGAFDIPSNVNASCHDINQDIAQYYEFSEHKAFDKSREDIIKEFNDLMESHNENFRIIIDGDKHNSLYDAKVIRHIYNIVNHKYIID